ncbi:MAG: site-specific integrase [Bifidobacteriaceae bacterium]|jgi:integrase|nr:site-specific integrase [Bifidobacteriaceae bacterium]
MPKKLQLSIYLAGILGLRVGEIVGLARKNFLLSQKKLCVRHQALKEVGGKTALAPLKTENSRRDIPIPDSLMPIIEQHLDIWVEPEDDAMVFTGKLDRIMNAESLNFQFRKAREKAGLPNARFHQLRHTAAINITAVSDIITTMSILGHSSMQVAMVYQHAVDSRRVDAINKAVDEIVKDKPIDNKNTTNFGDMDEKEKEKVKQYLLGQLMKLG